MRVKVERKAIRHSDSRESLLHVRLIGVNPLSFVPVQVREAQIPSHQQNGEEHAQGRRRFPSLALLLYIHLRVSERLRE